MTIQDLGSIGELVAALATVATLIYLAAQIRQNTRAMKASSVSTLHDVQLLTRDNDRYNALVLKSLRNEKIPPEDRLHMVERFYTIMRTVEGRRPRASTSRRTRPSLARRRRSRCRSVARRLRAAKPRYARNVHAKVSDALVVSSALSGAALKSDRIRSDRLRR